MTNSYKIASRINREVNASVTWMSDSEQFGVPEFWSEAGTFGDCEDYALLKRLGRVFERTNKDILIDFLGLWVKHSIE